MRSEVIGRETELAAIERFLQDARSQTLALAIEGDAGIGKTTLWSAAIDDAASGGFRVLSARPAESEAMLSFVALADLVGTAFDETRARLPPVQEHALGAALLRTEVREGLPNRTTATALVGVLAALAEQGAVLVAVDDVQWLDPASAHALAFAIRRLPAQVSLVIARRPGGAAELPLGLARALPDEQVVRIVPGPLSLAALHHLVRSRLDVSLPRPLLVRIADASGGNPFFALELARALAPHAGNHDAGEPLPIPRGLEELVAARLGGLSADARLAALAAAVASQPTRPLLVDALPSVPDIGAALLEAEEAGVLVFERERIRFSHPLLASVVYGSASQERRRQLHQRLAAVVADPEERARHLALSTTTRDEATASEVEAAARLAAARGAPQAAAELFTAAGRLTPESRVAEAGRRKLGEAGALLAAGDLGGARALAEDVAASTSGRLRGEAEILLGDIGWISGSFSRATQHLEAALVDVSDQPALAAGVYQKLVNYSVGNAPARAVEYVDAALAALDPLDAPGSFASIVFDRLWAEAALGRGIRPGLLERWRELEHVAGPESPMSPIPLIYYHSIDDFESARARHAVEDEWHRVRGEDGWRAERMGHRAFAEYRAGDWDLAERLVEDACNTIAQLERPGPWTMPYRFRSFVDAGRGRTSRARATLLPLIADAERSGRVLWQALFLSTLGVVEFTVGDHAAADEAFTRMHGCAEAIGMRDLVPDRSEPIHVESLGALGDVARARVVLEQLEDRGRTFPRLWIDATLPRTRALVLAGEGDVEAALAALDALDLALASALPFDLGLTFLVRGRLHRRLRQRGAAAEAFRQALEVFERLGAPVWSQRTRVELDRVGLRRASQELTATELRVAQLVAAGLTNREVAGKAFMSPKTVEANLARVYRKLGIHSRAELGARIAAAEPDGQT